MMAVILVMQGAEMAYGQLPSITSMQRRLPTESTPPAPQPVIESRPSVTTSNSPSFKTISDRTPEPAAEPSLAPTRPISQFRLPTVAQDSIRKPIRLPAPETVELQAMPANWDRWQGKVIGEPADFKPWHPPALLPELPYDELLESRRRALPIDSEIQQVDFEQATAVPQPGLSLAAFEPIECPPPLVNPSVCPSLAFSHSDDFSPTPLPVPPDHHDPTAAAQVYDSKHPVPVQRPWIEWGREFYGSGITPPSQTFLGKTNLVQQQLYLYGDFRTGIASGRNAASTFNNWASRLNLDLDYRITSTERFHAFFGPLNRATEFTRFERNNDRLEYLSFYNLNPVTGYFEGDLGALLGGVRGTGSQAELPVTGGLVPLLFQNGVWMEDAASGVAFGIPAKHSRPLKWSNYDATFFALFDQINSPAFGKDQHAGQAFGTAWFIDAYDGYIESGYAYLNDRENQGRSYHNLTTSFTRRYFDKISNSVRVIVNTGQDLARQNRTADGVLLLVENSLVTAQPMNVIPYFNLFSGWGRPQSVARAGVAGGVLRNTGINYEIDGLNGYPTLDATGADTFGGSLGIDLIGPRFDRQWILEASYLTPHGDRSFVNGDQLALGTRYQYALSHCTIIRFDTMYAWRESDRDLNGVRVEYRWKF